jgi:hypothetical protein
MSAFGTSVFRPVAAAVILLALAACTRADAERPQPVTPNRPVVARTPAPTPTAWAPRDLRTQADLIVTSGFKVVEVSVADIGDDLFHATSPGSVTGPTASVVRDLVAITDGGKPDGGASVLDVRLNPRVAWRVTLDGGANVAIVDLTGARVRGVDVTKGVSTIEMTLPAATGTTPIMMSGGASTMRLHLRGAAPVRTTMTGGAGIVTIDGAVHSGVAGGTAFVSPGWDSAPDRYDIDCAAGVSQLIVDHPL